ncbi:putative histone-lysine N-methyltransferase PRDM6 [Armadillidium nasatum]|uniref:Putative histone-lysine N-methyltransferase PRDM6 n=1 Tax=Armadillidium nasatum TaxID=96803 RepID=A0A5N5SLN5_9CRUS|nr:putative histone-lysine N-methyltransferase PRDM6 [Armadillidium nasatum]
MIGSKTMDIKPEVEIKSELSDMLTVEMTTYDEPFDHEFSPEENECDKESSEAPIRSSRELREKKKKEPTKFACSQCTYATFKKHCFTDHLFTHSNEKPYKCLHCEYACNRKFNLTKHLLTHSSTKLFKCDECDYSTNNKQTLTRHKLTHSDIKLFKCSECEYACNRKYHLSQHMLTHSPLRRVRK